MQRQGFFAGIAVLAATLQLAGPAGAQDGTGPGVHLGVVLPAAPDGDDGALDRAFLTSVEQGAIMAEEEFSFNASMFGTDFQVDVATADAGIEDSARRLVEDEGAIALIGGTDDEEARILGDWAAAHGVPFVNIAAAGDRLRNEGCAPTTFHIAPSAAMYLDALAGWYVRAGFRRWYFVLADTPEAEALHDRTIEALDARHFGAREAGQAIVATGADPDAAIDGIARSRADLIVLMLAAEEQLRFLAAMEAAGLEVETTGFPYPETQTRAFFAASRTAAPGVGTGHRAIDWEPTLDAYGARELNARYMARWGVPMENGAWGAYQAVKILYEASLLGGSATSEGILAYLGSPNSVFDVWKGIGTSFRPWDRQLRQPVYLAKIDPRADGLEAGLLVGELPAIYMPGTDPVDRLDQLGDLAAASECRSSL